jgi:hypothetical protein
MSRIWGSGVDSFYITVPSASQSEFLKNEKWGKEFELYEE